MRHSAFCGRRQKWRDGAKTATCNIIIPTWSGEGTLHSAAAALLFSFGLTFCPGRWWLHCSVFNHNHPIVLLQWAQIKLRWQSQPPICVVLRAASLKLMTSNWRNVMLVISFIIAVMNASRIISHNMSTCAKKGRLNYVMNFYSSNLKAHMSATARFAFCRFQLMARTPGSAHAAARLSAMVVQLPMGYAILERIYNKRAHSVGIRCPKPMNKRTKITWKE